MEKLLKEKQKEQALKLLGNLEVSGYITSRLKDKDLLCQSISNGPLGASIYELTNEYLPYIKDFENTYGAYVFHVIIDRLRDGGEFVSMLYVSSNEEEWEMDDRDYTTLQGDYGYFVNSYVYNTSMGMGEIGSIGIRPSIGGIKRTC